MTTATQPVPADHGVVSDEASRPRDPKRLALAVVKEIAGPLLIFVAVLAVLDEVAFRGFIPTENRDILSIWIPYHCYLGDSLAGGHVPAWNPYIMGGFPFAADPQSGWMYLPAMATYSALSCGAAIRAFIVLQPMIAGLGTYLFLRSEGVSRPSSSVGGMMMGLLLATSKLAWSLPFAGALAWTPLVLAAASRFLQARSWPARIAWGVVAAVAWGQLAAAHLSHGLVTGTGALVAYGIFRLLRERRAGRLSRRQSAGLVALFAGAALAVNLAVLLPRAAYTPRTSLSLGYDKLRDIQAGFLGIENPGFQTSRGLTEADWPLKLASSPPAPALLFVGAALFSKRHRGLAIALFVFGVICYVIGLQPVVESLTPVMRGSPLGDFYLHKTGRFRYGVLTASAILVGLGFEAWWRTSRWRTRALMLVPGLCLFGVLPALLGVEIAVPLLLFGGLALVAVGVLALLTRPVLAALACVVLAALPLVDEPPRSPEKQRVVAADASFPPAASVVPKFIEAATFIQPGAMVEALRQADDGTRLLSLDPPLDALNPDARLTAYRRLQVNRRSIPFGVEEVQGYNPSQLIRYWTFVQAVNPGRVRYNTSVFMGVLKPVVDLMAVGWVIAPGEQGPPGALPVAGQGGWVLHRLKDVPERVSVVSDFEVVDDEAAALDAVTQEGFDSELEAVLESDPGIAASGNALEGAETSYEAVADGEVAITMSSPEDALVVVRNVFDDNWSATVDGRDVELLLADYMLQAVAVPEGTHTIVLRYDDPYVRYGLIGSAIAVAVLAASATGLVFRSRRRSGEEKPVP